MTDEVSLLPSPSEDTGNCNNTAATGESFDNDSTKSSPNHNKLMERPNFGLYQMEIAALLLTTLLALGSAFDARKECINKEMYAWLLNLGDDDQVNMDDAYQYDVLDIQEGRAECLNMFLKVIVPTVASTFILCPLAVYIIHRRTAYLDTLSETYMPSHLGTFLRLLAPLILTFLAWTYANFSIMIKPKVDPSVYSENPFKSLAAVDSMGRVGDNANLYYMSWISHALSLVLVYQVTVDTFRAAGTRKPTLHLEHSRNLAQTINMHEQIQKMLAYTSARKLASIYKSRRRKWYQFMLHLRQRSGHWAAAFFASLVLFASSTSIYIQVLVSLATTIRGERNFQYRDVCSIVDGNSELPQEFCIRTVYAVLTGVIATILCLAAMLLHMLVRRKAANDERQNSCTIMATEVLPGALDLETTRFQLGIEFLLSFCLSVTLGVNAVFATGVQGPAVTVGNLYYASWATFLLCLRICLGCLEEIYHVKSPPNDQENRQLTLSGEKTEKSKMKELDTQPSLTGSEFSIDMSSYHESAKVERPSRLRKYFFLAIFSLACFAAAWDAAYNQEEECTSLQKYIILAPTLVAGFSIILFCLCLNPKSYEVASHICCGGIMSVVCFALWLVDLLLLMHSEDSWAVNGIGEMKLANLYYFSWASIITAGLQMFSYWKPLLLGSKSGKDPMFIVWAGIVKTCMVILGAALHVWYKIGDTCAAVGRDEADITYCSRTIFAFAVGAIGVLSGWLVMATRILGCLSSETRNIAETCLSSFLVVLFAVAVALITSIGGPGQTVGDLYYATWLSFVVSIGILVSCLDQIQQSQIERANSHSKLNDESTQYVDFDAVDGAL